MISSSKSAVKKNYEVVPSSLKWIKIFLLLLTMEGFLSILVGFATKSMDRNAFAFGYSKARLITAVGFLGVDLVFVIISVWAFVRPAHYQIAIEYISKGILNRQDRFPLILIILLYLTVTGSFILFIFMSPFLPSSYYPFQVAVERILIALIWVVSIPAQVFIALILWYARDIKLTLERERIGRLLLLFVILTTTSLHWITLLLKANWMSIIPGWFWFFSPVNKFHPSFSFLLVGGGAAFLTTLLIFRRPARVTLNLLICIGLGYAVQVLFGFADGNGFESIRSRYSQSGLSEEIRYVCISQAPLVASIKYYEPMYGVKFWYGTKPPGIASFYTIFRNVVQWFNPNISKDPDVCFDVISRVSAYLLPLVAALTMLFVFALNKLLLGNTDGFLSGILYYLAPNFLLMTLMPDQFLFPLLFTIVVFVAGVAIRKESFFLGLLVGVSIYIATFVSFSLLPVIGFVAAWIAIDHIISRDPRNYFRLALMVFGICLGIGILWVCGRVFLNYDPVSRYLAAFSSHRDIKEFTFSFSNLLQYSLLNNVEFAFWSGIPLVLLLAVGCIRSTISAFLGKVTSFDTFSIAFLVSYLGTNLIGQTRGEVGRLWLFWLPIGSIIAMKEAVKLMNDPVKAVILILSLQFVTSTLIYYAFNWI